MTSQFHNSYLSEPEAVCHQRRFPLHYNVSACKADWKSHNLKSYAEDCRSQEAKNGKMLHCQDLFTEKSFGHRDIYFIDTMEDIFYLAVLTC